MDLKVWDPNVYTIKPLNGKGPIYLVNQWQLFDLQKSQGDNSLDRAPDTTLAITLAKKTPNKTSPIKSSIWYQVQDTGKFHIIRLIFREMREALGLDL